MQRGGVLSVAYRERTKSITTSAGIRRICILNSRRINLLLKYRVYTCRVEYILALALITSSSKLITSDRRRQEGKSHGVKHSPVLRIEVAVRAVDRSCPGRAHARGCVAWRSVFLSSPHHRTSSHHPHASVLLGTARKRGDAPARPHGQSTCPNCAPTGQGSVGDRWPLDPTHLTVT